MTIFTKGTTRSVSPWIKGVNWTCYVRLTYTRCPGDSYFHHITYVCFTNKKLIFDENKNLKNVITNSTCPDDFTRIISTSYSNLKLFSRNYFRNQNSILNIKTCLSLLLISFSKFWFPFQIVYLQMRRNKFLSGNLFSKCVCIFKTKFPTVTKARYWARFLSCSDKLLLATILVTTQQGQFHVSTQFKSMPPFVSKTL